MSSVDELVEIKVKSFFTSGKNGIYTRRLKKLE